MANTYDADASTSAQLEQAEGTADTPDEETSEQGQGKLSQQEAGYRMGNPLVSCGLCGNFTGSAGSNPHQCTEVDGDISPYGYCPARYTRQDNPFLPGTQASFTEEESPAADEEQPEQPQPRLQIGNRSY